MRFLKHCMTMVLGLSLAGVFVHADSLLGGQPQEEIADFVGMGCEGPQKFGASRAGLAGLRANRSEGGLLSLVFNDRLYRISGLDQGRSKLVAASAVPVLPEGEIIGFRTKTRDGAWFAQSRDRQSILEWDAKRHRWIPCLMLTGRPFHDFEVGRDGQLVIIRPGGAEGAGHLIEVYDPHGQAPHAAFDFPDLSFSQDETHRYQGIWNFPITAVNGDMVAVYLPFLGRLYLADLLRRTLREVPVPWGGYSRETLESEFKAHGLINVTHPSVGCIQLIPVGAGDFWIVYRRSGGSKLRKVMKDGRIELIRVGEAGANGPLTARYLTSASGTLGPEDVHPELGFPVWPDAKGVLKGIQKALESYGPPSP